MLPGSVVFAYHLQAGNATLHGIVLVVNMEFAHNGTLIYSIS